MILRVKVIGSGNPGDHYRVNLPTYRFIFANYEQRYAYVDLPDDIHELTEDDLVNDASEVTSYGRFYPTLSDSTLKVLHAKFDDKYQEHKGEFRVELA